MSGFVAGPSYKLSAKRSNAAVSAIDGVCVQVADSFRIQSIKMPEYASFSSNALTLSANDYTFSLENNVLSKFQVEEKAAAVPKVPDRPPPPPPIQEPSVKREPMPSYPVVPMPSGGLLRPSAASSTPRNSGGQDSGSTAILNTRNSNKNEWADFERSHDLFDDLELKSIDDRHELARVLVNNGDHHSESQPNTPHRSQQSGPPNAPPIASLDDYKKLSLSDNNLSNLVTNSSAAGGRNSPAPCPTGPSYSSVTDLPSTTKPNSSNLPVRSSGLPRPTPTPPPQPQVQLSSAQQSAVAYTAAMGFDRQLCSRLAHDLDTDVEEVLANAVLAHSSLVANGHSADNAERVLVLVGGDETKARNVLEASSYLEQFGFTRNVIYAAVSRLSDKKSEASTFGNSEELRDKLLDMLTADSH